MYLSVISRMFPLKWEKRPIGKQGANAELPEASVRTSRGPRASGTRDGTWRSSWKSWGEVTACLLTP